MRALFRHLMGSHKNGDVYLAAIPEGKNAAKRSSKQGDKPTLTPSGLSREGGVYLATIPTGKLSCLLYTSPSPRD